MSLHRPRLRMEATPENATVTPLELFFDLVFVFALTQVTALMAEAVRDHHGPQGVLRGVLILALLWWSWVGYAWLSNVVRADEGHIRFLLLAAMAAMFVIALTIPEAFDDFEGGLYGPIVIAIAYFVLRLTHLALFWVISSEDPGLRRQLVKWAPSVLGGTGLLLAASMFDGATQTALWAAALAADYVGTALGGAEGWRLRSAGHFAERHGLILIVALGESIVAIGVGVANEPISWPIVAASTLGLVLSAGLWWAYFDVSAIQAEHALATEPEATRPRLARDAYSFLHFPLVASIVFVALGLEKVLEYVSDLEHHSLSDALSPTPLYALYGGVVVYLLAHIGFKWRMVHHVQANRLVFAGVVVALAPFAVRLPALAALAVLTCVMVALNTFETIRYAEHRDRVRHQLAQH